MAGTDRTRRDLLGETLTSLCGGALALNVLLILALLGILAANGLPTFWQRPLALFTLIGAPPSLGVALALAKRVNQIVFAGLGFGVLAVDRIATQVDHDVTPLSRLATSTARQAVVGP